jgi:predicted AlkP superfamily pyrophosphatase or phosphodiesterase
VASYRALAFGLLVALERGPLVSQTSTPARQTGQQSRPTLVVLLTVDQLRPDYLTLYEQQLGGGLGRLLRGGAVFLDAYQDHAITETAPGHASTLSGRFPRSTGIVSNSAGVYDPQAPLLGARGDPASPFRFRGSTLVDWLRQRSPASRALSVSRKDRGAILPIGRAKQAVFWYASNGTFTTSSYYADTLPSWVKSFNARRLPQQYAGKDWDLMLPATQYSEPDSVPLENGGRDFVFPHRFPSDSAQAAAVLPNYPMMDDLTLAFALEGVRQLQLGAGSQSDILAISLSSTDAVGHRFGPDSRELHDQLLRLDRSLGWFLDSLFALRDSNRIVIALTADHGVAPLPEATSRYRLESAGRANLRPVVDSVLAKARRLGADSSAIQFEDMMLLLDRDGLAQKGLDPDSIARNFRAQILRVPGVLRADMVRGLGGRDTVTDYIARRWLHMLPPDLPVAVVVTLRPYWYLQGIGYATHGTPHDYDARVPVIFSGAGVQPGRYQQRVRVVDIAPTLASLLGVAPLERVDGRTLRFALRRKP